MLNSTRVTAISSTKNAIRSMSSSKDRAPVSRRAMLYVPGSNIRMLEKSLLSSADSIAYDLEDSVTPGKKVEARARVSEFMDGESRPRGEVVARINAVGSGYEDLDLDSVLRTRNISAIALPKTNSPDHVDYVVSVVNRLASPEKRTGGSNPIRIIAMIESAIGMISIKEISRAGKGHLDALLFAAEDYCADLGITRTHSRTELLYPRSKLVMTARAFGLQAIDLVCVRYKDDDFLRTECQEGRIMGFDGKQAIHPGQIDTIHAAYSPSAIDVRNAARIIWSFEHHDEKGTGAYVLDGLMIDAPVYKQAQKVLAKARAAGIEIPMITAKDI